MNMQSGAGGNSMNAAQLARLQQQLAQYGGGNSQQQMMAAMNQQQQQQYGGGNSQQLFMQQQYGGGNNQHGSHMGGMSGMNSMGGMNGNNSAASLMLQQQQQQQQQQVAGGNSQMANANMSSYWNVMQNNNNGGGGLGSMDASSASSAQLAALTGMNMGGLGQPQQQQQQQQQGHNNNMQALLGTSSTRSQASNQQPSLGGDSQMQRMGGQQQQNNQGQLQNMNGGGDNQSSLLLQQQIAQLQRQLQQQQAQQAQQQMQQSNQGMGGDRRSSGNSNTFQMNQQQLFQLMNQQQRPSSASSNMLQQMSNGMLGQDNMGMGGQLNNNNGGSNDQFNMVALMQNTTSSSNNNNNNMLNMRNSITPQTMLGNRSGSLSDQDLLMQQRLLSQGSGMNNDGPKTSQEPFLMQQRQQQANADLLGRRSLSQNMQSVDHGLGTSMSSQHSSQQQQQQPPMQNINFINNNNNSQNNFDLDGSINSQNSNNGDESVTGNNGGSNNSNIVHQIPTNQQQNQQAMQAQAAAAVVNNSQMGTLDLASDEAVRKMDELTAAQKSFLDGSFAGGWQSNADLPDRRRIIFSILEVIRQMRPDTNKISQKLPHMAKSLEEHLYRSAQTKEEYLDPLTLKKRLQLIAHGLELHRTSSSGSINGSNNGLSEAQQLQQLLQNHDSSSNNRMGGSNESNNMTSDLMSLSGQSTSGGMNRGSDSSKFQDPIAAQKKKVIRQQQQRLLLLRHASKCKDGPNCKTKFCGQMMTLWKHMKSCRDRNCKTSHCLSSRCVLNHYRICKHQNRTSSCEVCGPVMEQIKRQDQNDDSGDPLAARPDPDLPAQPISLAHQNSFGSVMTSGSNMGRGGMLGMQQQNNISNNNMSMQIQHQSMGNVASNAVTDDSQGSSNGGGNNANADPQQMQQLQIAQQKLFQQRQVLEQLQHQQTQLLEQQKQLQEQQQHLKDPQTQQAQQIKQQHDLLRQLQRRCQEQQQLIQQELLMQMKTLQEGGQMMPGMMNQMQNNTSNNMNMVMGMGMMGQNNQMQSNNGMGMMDNNQMQQTMDPTQLGGLGGGVGINNGMMGFGDNNGNPMLNNGSSQQNDFGIQQQQNFAQMMGLQNQTMGGGSDMPSQVGAGDDEVDDNQQSIDPLSSGPQDHEDRRQPLPGQQQQHLESPENQQLTGDSESGKSDKRRGTKTRSSSSAGAITRGASARGRGGKGKRLREMAPDLSASAGSRAGGSLDKSAAEEAAQSVIKKRGVSELHAEENEQSNKSRKTGEGDDNDDGEKNPEQGEVNHNASMSSSMPKADVEQHLESLHKGLHLTSRTITQKCLPIVQQLIDDPFGWVFRDAVDPVVFGLPDYFEVVKNPMHLLLVKKKLENAVYTDMASFERDVKLVFENAILYNGEESEVGQLAKTMMSVFEKEYKKVCEGINASRQELEESGDACALCGQQQKLFAPSSIIRCRGNACEETHIPRGAVYYTDVPHHRTAWCQTCFTQFPDNRDVVVSGIVISKLNLERRTNRSSIAKEAWIQCAACAHWSHQICSLVNASAADPNLSFNCLRCVADGKHASPSMNAVKSARNLPHSKLSDAIQTGVQKLLEVAYQEKSQKFGINVGTIQKVQGLTVRVVSHVATTHKIEGMLRRELELENAPVEFPIRRKCIAVFQSINGIDVLLFAMYVDEYGKDCHRSMRGRAYVSYTDFVNHIIPNDYRTIVFHAILIEYLRAIKSRGFRAAHIWSHPPSYENDGIFFCHPEKQSAPMKDIIREWYRLMLEKARNEDVVHRLSNIYQEYVQNADKNPKLSTIPLFAGDYVSTQLETILRGDDDQISHRDSSDRSRSSTVGTQNTFQRIGELLKAMQQDFMVVYLGPLESDKHEDDNTDNENVADAAVEKGEEEEDDSDDGDDSNDSDYAETGSERSPLPKSKSRAKLAQKKASPSLANDDPDNLLPGDIFETRQMFYDFCKRNHCQFDELRRAKHSTMIALVQLHNSLEPPVSFDWEQSLTLLQHAVNCKGKCDKSNCSEMKKAFDHFQNCSKSYRRGCAICAKMHALLTRHMLDCDEGCCKSTSTGQERCSLSELTDPMRKDRLASHRRQIAVYDQRRRAQNAAYPALFGKPSARPHAGLKSGDNDDDEEEEDHDVVNDTQNRNNKAGNSQAQAARHHHHHHNDDINPSPGLDDVILEDEDFDDHDDILDGEFEDESKMVEL